jgi:cytochrome c biogenesis protein CcdA/thiol-disulfide isomerase/thioredoxin
MSSARNHSFLSIIAIVLLLSVGFPLTLKANNKVDLVLFYGQGCPHCAGMIGFLEKMEMEYPQLEVHKYEVYSHKENIPLFQRLAQEYGKGINAVPTAFVGDKSFVGFSNQIGNNIENKVKQCISNSCLSPLQHLRPTEDIGSSNEKMQITKEENNIDQDSAEVEDTIVNTPTVLAKQTKEKGQAINKEQQDQQLKQESDNDFSGAITIPAVTGAAVVDAINPCAFAVLIILITTILASGKKRRALLSGLAFSLSIFISYFLMGLGLYSAIQASGLTHTFYAVIAALAIVIGLFNLKDYLWYGKWFVMEVPMSWRPKLKTLIRSVTSVPGAFFIGFAVSLFLLPCTSGPYIVILGLLAHTTTKGYAIALLAFYNLIFVSPMILITGAVYYGLTTTEKAEEWRTKKLKILHLIAGIIILGLGIIMLGSLWLGYI